MVDRQMASPNSKFGAPVTFYSGNETRSDFNRVIYQGPSRAASRR